MSAGPTRPATREGLMVWVMHRFARALGEQAVIKGGMALRLLDSPRSTNDIDYVFVPYWVFLILFYIIYLIGR